jgi:DNA-binding NarL/FixJ family response regulator
MITVLIVDDHAQIRKGLCYLLETAKDMQVVATAENGIEAVTQAQLSRPDVAVMDISMPLKDGIEATRQMRLSCPITRVIILSIYNSSDFVQRALNAGAFGYVLKELIATDLVAAIRTIYQGKRYFSLPIAEIAKRYS